MNHRTFRLKLLRDTFLEIHDAGFFFRVLGYGIRVVDRTKQKALFSERNGLGTFWRIGKWSIAPLKRSPFYDTH